MDIYTILSTIFRYSLLALGGIAALVPLYAAGFLIYKKVFHGTKKLQIGQWISLILLSGWLLLVLGLTTFSRGANLAVPSISPVQRLYQRNGLQLGNQYLCYEIGKRLWGHSMNLQRVS